MNIEPLFEDGFMPVDLGRMHELSQRVIGAFCNVIKMDMELPQVDIGVPNATPLGFTRKERGEENGVPQDGKWYLHIDRGGVLERRLQQEGLAGYEEIQYLITQSRYLLELYEQIALEVLGELEKTFPNIKSFFVGENGELPWLTLRLLAYDHPNPEDKEGILAAAHRDKSGITFTGYETGPGLEVEDASGTWKPFEYQENNGLLMIGTLISKITGGACKEVWHRVVRAHEECAIEGDVSRFTIVCFCDPFPERLRIPDAYETHGIMTAAE